MPDHHLSIGCFYKGVRRFARACVEQSEPWFSQALEIGMIPIYWEKELLEDVEEFCQHLREGGASEIVQIEYLCSGILGAIEDKLIGPEKTLGEQLARSREEVEAVHARFMLFNGEVRDRAGVCFKEVLAQMLRRSWFSC